VFHPTLGADEVVHGPAIAGSGSPGAYRAPTPVVRLKEHIDTAVPYTRDYLAVELIVHARRAGLRIPHVHVDDRGAGARRTNG